MGCSCTPTVLASIVRASLGDGGVNCGTFIGGVYIGDRKGKKCYLVDFFHCNRKESWRVHFRGRQLFLCSIMVTFVWIESRIGGWRWKVRDGKGRRDGQRSS